MQKIDFSTLFARLDFWISIALFTIGIVMVKVASGDSNSLYMMIGSTLVGSGFSGVMSAFANNARDKDMWLRLDGGIPDASFSSKDSDLVKYRRVYHIYRITENSAGNVVWVHKALNFKRHVTGKIQANYVLNDREYVVEGFLKRDALILCSSPVDQDRELQSVSTFHDFTTGIQKSYCGVLMLQTWRSNRRSVSPTIISSEVLFDIGEEGFIERPDKAKALDDFWHESMRSLNYNLLPRAVV